MRKEVNVKKAMVVLGMATVLMSAVWSETGQKSAAGTLSAGTALTVTKAPLTQAPQPPNGLYFVSFSVGPIGLGCARTHSATMCNNTAKPITNGEYVVNYWARPSASQPWERFYGGWFAYDFAPGETKSFNLYFNIPLNSAEIRVTVNPDHSPNSPVVCEAVAPAVHLPLDKIAVTGQFTATGWTVTIANNSTMYFCSDNIVGYKATLAKPDAWVPCGGTVPPEEIAPGTKATTLTVNPGAGWKTGYRFFKVVIYDGNVIYLQRTIDMGNP
jgi:hypothetical protein